MLVRIGIENFKAFGPKQTARIAPLTLLYGPNSAGKTTVLQVLKLLHQSFPAAAPSYPLRFSGPAVDLGGFTSTVFRNKDLAQITVDLDFAVNPASLGSTPEPFRRNWLIACPAPAEGAPSVETIPLGVSLRFGRRSPRSGSGPIDAQLDGVSFRGVPAGRQASFRAPSLRETSGPSGEFRWEGPVPVWYREKFSSWGQVLEGFEQDLAKATTEERRQELRQVLELMRKHREDSGTLARGDSNAKERWKALRALAELRVKASSLSPGVSPSDDWSDWEGGTKWIPSELATIPWLLRDPKVKADREDGGARYWLYPIAAVFSGFVRDLEFLGPLRAYPRRLYAGSAEWNESVGQNGENLAGALVHSPGLLQRLNKVLPIFGFPYEISVSPVGNDRFGSEFRVLLRDLRTNTETLLGDTGFGVSQAIPILAQGMLSALSGEQVPWARLVGVEQPEIHLHPRLQAQMADFFSWTAGVDSANPLSRRKGTAAGVQWVIETHSEALILRLQRRIREGRLRREDVSVLFVSPTGDGSRISELRMNAAGDFIDEWPGGFFAERIDEILGD